MRSERAAVEWVLATRGYIAADGSMLDQMARRVWEQWWLGAGVQAARRR